MIRGHNNSDTGGGGSPGSLPRCRRGMSDWPRVQMRPEVISAYRKSRVRKQRARRRPSRGLGGSRATGRSLPTVVAIHFGPKGVARRIQMQRSGDERRGSGGGCAIWPPSSPSSSPSPSARPPVPTRRRPVGGEQHATSCGPRLKFDAKSHLAMTASDVRVAAAAVATAATAPAGDGCLKFEWGQWGERDHLLSGRRGL